jgi:hypothetical protein
MPNTKKISMDSTLNFEAFKKGDKVECFGEDISQNVEVDSKYTGAINFYKTKINDSSETRDKRSSKNKPDSLAPSITNIRQLQPRKDKSPEQLIKNMKSPSVNISDLLTKSHGLQKSPSEVFAKKKSLIKK